LERGVGINVVKNMVDKHNGMIEVDFEENKYCEFTISLPLPK
jgi:chemotaxis protein histidine kinase CheA